ncbi:MAG: ATP-dependent helicase HrpB [Lysobacteraceae bacterium]
MNSGRIQPDGKLPVNEILPALRETLGRQSRALLQAPPGAGKTTQVPLALLEEDWLGGQRILMLEPRRIAARSAATFMARQLREAVGDTVGYRIRFEKKVSSKTRVEVVTEGILTRMIQDDPTLDGFGLLIFDEFHERHLQGDLGLALALDVQSSLRPELRILLMSATLDGEPLSRFLDAPMISSEGRSFPVRIEHQPARRDEALGAQLRRALDGAMAATPGDALVFLPGQREIGQAMSVLGDALPDDVELLPLHGELSVEAQAAALQPTADGQRRVVLATNVAESSVTLPGVRIVIDSGLAREPRHDPNSGFSRLETVAISQASADQRAGRAGRVAEGICIRLWSSEQRRDPQRRAEIQQVELSGLALEIAAWGNDDLRFPDPPPSGALSAARDLLQRLGALDENRRIAPLGQRMLSLGASPRLAAMLLNVNDRDVAAACDLAALLEARDPLRQPGDDLMPRWRALQAFRQKQHHDGSRAALSAIARAASQWRRRLRVEHTSSADVSAQQVGRLLAHAFPDRIARRNPSDPLRYALSNGRSARLHPSSDLLGHAWLAVAELRHERGDALIQRALPLSEDDLRQDWPQRFRDINAAIWDAARGMLVARREQRFDSIVIDSRDGGRIEPEQAARALTDAVIDNGLTSLNWDDTSEQLLQRLRCLREWMPELALPDLSDEALTASADDWLLPAFSGQRRLADLNNDALRQAIWSVIDRAAASDPHIDPQLRRRIDTLAPTALTAPSGIRAPIRYQHGESPVLSVKLQAMFGLAETPRVADGRVPLTLHLLSPAGRPLQVTSDLSHFWNHSYADVRREMKGRYPKHPWPDDPWSAKATHRTKARST